MSITPVRPHAHSATSTAESHAADASKRADAESSTNTASVASEGSMPHNQQVYGGSAAQWVATQRRALPAAAMGMRAGTLAAPGGTLAARPATGLRGIGNAGAKGRPGNFKSPLGRSSRGQSKSAVHLDEESDASESDDTGGMARGGATGEFGAPVSMQFNGDAMGSGDQPDGTELTPEQLAALHLDPSVEAPSRIARQIDATEGRVQTQKPSAALSAAQLLASRVMAGQLCWVANLKLAMQCAQMHPGTDIFVQAFTLVDGDGDVIPMLSRRARLRATAEGTVNARASDNDEHAADSAGASAHDPALMAELATAPLMSLSLRPVIDESGQAMAGIQGARQAELHQLRHLFERPLPASMRAAIWAASEQLMARWQALGENPDFAERMARHGDALERSLNEQRTRLSETIHTPSGNAYRARANWMNAQAQVTEWARRGHAPDFDSMLRLNALLGEGLRPWNKPELATQAGARFGVLRHFDVVSGVPPHHYLRADQLLQAMIELLDWLEANRTRLPPPVLAAQCFQRVVSLHPFADANGRSARLLADWVLQLVGLPPALLDAGNVALFPNETEAANLPAGTAEQQMVSGLLQTLALHADWLQIDDADE